MTYQRRILDDTLDRLLPYLPAISIEGAKGTGKTSTAARRTKAVLAMDDPAVRSLVESDISTAILRVLPVLIDEWQLLPPIWDAVRREVDRDSSGGRFLLTGSATMPEGTRVHSGAGRIVGLRLRPMTLPERGVTQPEVSLKGLGDGDLVIPTNAATLFKLSDYVIEILRSGFPGIRDYPDDVQKTLLNSYIDRIVNHEIPEAGGHIRRPVALKAWLAAYAAATATTASYSAILQAASPNESDKPARATVDKYRELLTRLWILDPLPAWTPSFSHLKGLGASSKHHLADPALAAVLLGADQASLLTIRGTTLQPGADATLLGALFESLVTLSVRVFAEAHGWTVSHLRTRNGNHEIDLIVELDGLRILPIEVKLARTIEDSDVRHLLWLRQELGDRVTDLVVINTGPYAYRRADGVAVVPLALLGA